MARAAAKPTTQTSWPALGSEPPVRTRGFTIIELLVVMVVLAIAAVAVVPRFMSTARQEADIAVDRVAEIMRLFAYRESMSSQQVGIWRDPATGRIQLLVMDINPSEPDAAPDWRPDRFAAPVVLPDEVSVVDVRVNDQPRRTDEFMIASVPGAQRPKIEMHLVGSGVDATLILPPGSPSVVRADADREAPLVRGPIDLDRAGRDQEPW